MGETDNPKGAKTSEGEGGSTSEETPTLTQKQVDALVTKARSDALAEVGRLKKAAEESNKIAQDVLKRLQAKEEDDLRREEDAVRDDPDRLSSLKLKREGIRAKAEAEEIKRRIESEKAELQGQRQELLQHRADRFAERYNVDVGILLKYGGDNRESMEELAKSFGERTPGESGNRLKEPPDSGKTKGSSGELTVKQVRGMSKAEQNARIAELAKLDLTVI